MTTVFDHHYSGYDAWYESQLGQFVDKIETHAMLSLLPDLRNKNILEIGCGTGHFSRIFEELGASVTGIDISEKMLITAKARSLTPENYQQMDAAHLTFDDDQFDIVFSVTAFEFMDDIKQVYSEMRRVLKPGGTLLIATIQAESSWAEFYHSEACRGTAFDHAHFKSLAEIIELDLDNFIKSKEVLFFPPTIDESEYNEASEHKYQAQGNIGGFICVSFKK